MDVRLLYFDGCPNWQETDRRLQDAIAVAGHPLRLEYVKVATPEDAERLRFRGSPTVLVDGADPFADEVRPSACPAACSRPPTACVVRRLLSSSSRSCGEGCEPVGSAASEQPCSNAGAWRRRMAWATLCLGHAGQHLIDVLAAPGPTSETTDLAGH